MDVGHAGLYDDVWFYSSIGPVTWLGHEELGRRRPENGDCAASLLVAEDRQNRCGRSDRSEHRRDDRPPQYAPARLPVKVLFRAQIS